MVDTAAVYKAGANDIVERLKIAPDSPEAAALIAQIKWETDLFSVVLANLVGKHGGWMLLTAFTVSFVELKKTQELLQGVDREAVQGMMQAVIGSFGRTVQ